MPTALRVESRRSARTLLVALGPLALAAVGSGVLMTELVKLLDPGGAVPTPLATFFRAFVVDGHPGAVLLAVVVAPVLEELLFRRGLLGVFLAFYRPVPAVACSALLFAMLHGNAHQGLAALWLGLALGALYVRTRSWLLCAAGHAAWNAQWWLANRVLALPIPGYTIVPPADGSIPPQPDWWLGLGLLMAVTGVAILVVLTGDGTGERAS